MQVVERKSGTGKNAPAVGRDIRIHYEFLGFFYRYGVFFTDLDAAFTAEAFFRING